MVFLGSCQGCGPVLPSPLSVRVAWPQVPGEVVRFGVRRPELVQTLTPTTPVAANRSLKLPALVSSRGKQGVSMARF